MAKIKVTTKFKIAEFIDRFMTGHLASELGKAIVDGAKSDISEGQSPVRGHGRFARYKDRAKYPGDIKPARPVNLNLSGDMLAAFDSRFKSGNTIEVGIVKGSQEIKDRAKWHNEGTEAMAMRRFIPQDGEEFSVRIMRRVRELYGIRLNEVIKQSNKKE